MVKRSDESLDVLFRALADGTRRGMLRRLARGPLGVSELAAPLDMSLPAVSKHLTVLERARLITRTRTGRRRLCRVAPAGLAPADRWLEGTRKMWTESFDALDGLLGELTGTRKARKQTRRRHSHDR